MFLQCRQYLIDKLTEAGVRPPVVTSQKRLRTSQDSHIGAVLFESETYARSGQKRRYQTESGDQQRRRKVFDRELTFDVVIGEYEQEKAEEIVERFISLLDRGLYIDGNYVYLEVEEADWVDQDDSILKAKIAVQVTIKFVGGVYRDTKLYDADKLGLDIQVERSVPGKE
ncbi:SON protein [Harryflintia acetispora]|uniref:SON protein n=1 Tax=Harryflintia acetispora TaxID=1849041 RepID=A0A9X8Y894_9FIRM|nr:SON protein [Harryflintia acetispora]TCL43219.1 hypothetical protein EDD78_10679 [Harryflintia acetispora]